ncbi:kinase-like protein [Peniophora sp. CONT]|nr:kinase-like protein [Peniophora sp. CONT]
MAPSPRGRSGWCSPSRDRTNNRVWRCASCASGRKHEKQKHADNHQGKASSHLPISVFEPRIICSSPDNIPHRHTSRSSPALYTRLFCLHIICLCTQLGALRRMSLPTPLPLGLHVPELTAAELRQFCREEVLACFLPLGPNPASLPILRLEQSHLYNVWLVTFPPNINDRDPETKYIYDYNFHETPLEISWNLSNRCIPERGSLDKPAARFTLISKGERDIYILKLDHTANYTAAKLQPGARHTLRGHDIIALPAQDDIAFHYYVFKPLIELYPELAIHDDYQFLRPLGFGSYGVVFLATDRKTGGLVAVKRLKWPAFDVAGVEHMEKEARHLHRLKAAGAMGHICEILYSEPDIEIIALPMLGRLGDRQLRDHAITHVVLEYCEGGSLTDFVIGLPNRLTEPEVLFLGQQILRGLQAAHNRAVIHRDLKPGNILMRWTPHLNIHNPCVDGRRPEHDIRNWSIKLADFGSAKQWRADHFTETPGVGTIGWLAPELDPTAGGRAGTRTYKSDIWTAGYILAALLVDDVIDPARNNTIHKACTDVAFSDGCRAVMNGLLQLAPDDRCSISDALAHPWFADHDPNNLYAAIETAPTTHNDHAVEESASGESGSHEEESLTLVANVTIESEVETMMGDSTEGVSITSSHLARAGLWDISSGEESTDDWHGSDAATTPIAIPVAPPVFIPPPVVAYTGPDAPNPFRMGTASAAETTTIQSEHTVTQHTPQRALSSAPAPSVPDVVVRPERQGPSFPRIGAALSMAPTRRVLSTQSELRALPSSRSSAGGRYGSLRETRSLSNVPRLGASEGRAQFWRLKNMGRVGRAEVRVGDGDLPEEDEGEGASKETDMMDLTE